MEIFAIVAVVTVLCVLIGVSTGFLATAALAVIGILIVLMAAFFVFFFAVFIKSRPVKGTFIRTEKHPKHGFKTAYYLVEGTEYPNVFPAESLSKRLYKTDRAYSLRLNTKKGIVFDKFAGTTCILGLISGLALTGLAAWLFKGII